MKKILFAIAGLAISVTAYCQTEATTKDGKKVILNKNGTWKYAASAGSADCSLLIDNNSNGEGNLSLKSKSRIFISNNGVNQLEVLMLKSSYTVTLNFGRVKQESICLSEKAPATLYFTDGTSTILNHMGKLNCEGNFSVFLDKTTGTEEQLKLISAKKMKKINITYSRVINGKVVTEAQEINFTAAEADKIYQTIKCFETFN